MFRHRRLGAEHGSILIQVGLGILTFSAFLVYVVDYGVLWVSRNQAQNAADAGALAGAISLALILKTSDETPDITEMTASAQAFAARHVIWGEAPATGVSWSGGSGMPEDAFPTTCLNDCVRVDAGRDTLPTFFGTLIGVTEQRVRASAVARALPANAVHCLKPWAVLDDNAGQPFNTNDIGTEVTLSIGGPSGAPGTLVPLDLSSSEIGDPFSYQSFISGCAPGTWRIGSRIPKLPDPSSLFPFTSAGVADLAAADTATWNGNRVQGGCSAPGSSTPCAEGLTQSPRLVAVPLFTASGEEPTAIGVSNFLVLFVDDTSDGAAIRGRVAMKAAVRLDGVEAPSISASFLRTVQLVR